MQLVDVLITRIDQVIFELELRTLFGIQADDVLPAESEQEVVLHFSDVSDQVIEYLRQKKDQGILREVSLQASAEKVEKGDYKFDFNKIPHLGRYVLALAGDIEECEDLSAREIATKFLMELDLCDSETPSPFMTSQLPYQQTLELIKKVEALLIEQRLDPGLENFAGYPNEKRRIKIASEIFPMIVEAMLPQVILQNGEEETYPIDFTAHGRITFRGKGPEDLVGEAKSIIENLRCHDSQVKDLDIHRVDIYS